MTAKDGTELPFDVKDIPTIFWSGQRSSQGSRKRISLSSRRRCRCGPRSDRPEAAQREREGRTRAPLPADGRAQARTPASEPAATAQVPPGREALGTRGDRALLRAAEAEPSESQLCRALHRSKGATVKPQDHSLDNPVRRSEKRIGPRIGSRYHARARTPPGHRPSGQIQQEAAPRPRGYSNLDVSSTWMRSEPRLA